MGLGSKGSIILYSKQETYMMLQNRNFQYFGFMTKHLGALFNFHIIDRITTANTSLTKSLFNCDIIYTLCKHRISYHQINFNTIETLNTKPPYISYHSLQNQLMYPPKK